MKAHKLIACTVALGVAQVALAGPGIPLGGRLGTAVGFQLGRALPVEIGGLLALAGASLGLGIWIVRRKKKR